MSQLAYTDSGNGIPLVLLHGFCESKELWTEFSIELSQYFRVITVDLPGFGESTQLKITQMETLAESIYALLEDLRITKCVMVGHSLGGYVSLAFAESHPDYLLGLGLFHSTVFADPEEKKLNRNKTIEFLKANGVPAFIEPFVPGLFYPKFRKNHADAIHKLIDIGLKTSASAIIATTEAMRDRKDRSEVIKSLNVPVLYIIGKNDNAVPLESSLLQIALPQTAHVLILDDTAHMGMFERKKETFQFLKGFVENC
ncbi:MAG: alpha/beta hydrolase [Cytophagales bacterium]|nr:alpha/beta hydrolase [Cytophagales bacterium]